MEKDKLEENLSYLKEIAELCKRKQVELVVVTMPVTKAYNERKSEEYNNFREVLKEQAKKENFKYLDYTDSPNFLDQHFKDSDHLNVFGAEFLTKNIQQQLN